FPACDEVHYGGGNFFPRRSAGRTAKSTYWAAADSDPRSVQQFSEDRHLVSKPAAVRGVEDPGAGRAAASTTDCEVWAGQRKALRRATGVVGAGAGSQRCRGRGRKPTRVASLFRKSKAQASWAPDPAGGPSARGEARGLHAGAVPVRRLRGGDDGDRLRGERAVGCRSGEILRAGDQAREARLQAVRGAWRDGGAAAGADHREVAGQRPGGDRYDCGEVLRLPAAVSAERHAAARLGDRDQPRHHGGL